MLPTGSTGKIRQEALPLRQMNKLLLSLPLALLALALPAAASAGGGHAPDRPVDIQIWCGPDAECEPPTEFCEIAFDEGSPVPAQENCVWPEDTCVTSSSEDGPVPDECFWPEDPCDVPVSSEDTPTKGHATPNKGEVPPDEGEAPESDVCEYPDFPDDYCYFEDGSGESEDPGYEDPGDLVCIYDLAPAAQEKAKAKRRAAARQRAQTRRKAAVKRAQTRRQAARKRAAAKRAKLKAKKAAQARYR